MLANSHKSQGNSKVLSILEKASSRGSSRTATSNTSQRISQANSSKPNFSLLSSSLSSQDRQTLFSSSLDSQKLPYGLPSYLQRQQNLPDPIHNPYFQHSYANNTFRSPYPGCMPESVHSGPYNGRQSQEDFPGAINYSQLRSQNPLNNSVLNSQRISLPLYSQNEYERLMPFQQSYSAAFEKPYCEDSSYQFQYAQNHSNSYELEKQTKTIESQTQVFPEKISVEESSQKTEKEASKSNIFDELRVHVISNLNSLKHDLLKEVYQSQNLGETQEIVLSKFNMFEESLKQILLMYEQFEDQLKNVEALFIDHTQRVLKDFEDHSEEIQKTQDHLVKEVDHERALVAGKLYRWKGRIEKNIEKNKEKQRLAVRASRAKVNMNTKVIYERKMKPFPSYASVHKYYTRNSEACEKENTDVEKSFSENSNTETEELKKDIPNVLQNKKTNLEKKNKEEKPKICSITMSKTEKEEKSKKWKY